MKEVIAAKPKLPPALFGELIRSDDAELDLLEDKPLLRRAVLDGFWQGFVERFGQRRE